MANIVWTILIPQNCIDFRSWENRTYTEKLLLSLIQTSKNKKWYIQQNLHTTESKEITKLWIKEISRSELKFFIYTFTLGHPVFIFNPFDRC